MKAVIQRVECARVEIEEKAARSIEEGLLVLLGVEKGDTKEDCAFLAQKVVNLRIFSDERGKMNRSVLDIGGEMMVVSNFTLCGNCGAGRRPSFEAAAEPSFADEMYNMFVNEVKASGLKKVETGQFGASMRVSLVNFGPVTFVLDTKELR